MIFETVCTCRLFRTTFDFFFFCLHQYSSCVQPPPRNLSGLFFFLCVIFVISVSQTFVCLLKSVSPNVGIRLASQNSLHYCVWHDLITCELTENAAVVITSNQPPFSSVPGVHKYKYSWYDMHLASYVSNFSHLHIWVCNLIQIIMCSTLKINEHHPFRRGYPFCLSFFLLVYNVWCTVIVHRWFLMLWTRPLLPYILISKLACSNLGRVPVPWYDS